MADMSAKSRAALADVVKAATTRMADKFPEEQRAESWRKGMDRYLAVIAERDRLRRLLYAALDIADREADREGHGPVGSWGKRKEEIAALRAEAGR